MIGAEDIKLEDLPEEFRDVAERIGMQAALELVSWFQGCQLYVPKMETITRQIKYRKMYDYFIKTGCYKRVANAYGLSESHTRQIIKEEKSRRYPSKAIQKDLFN